MSVPGSASPLFLATAAAAAAAPAAHQVDRSLRFAEGDQAYLNRTPSSAGNRKTYTLSFWVKKSKIGDEMFIFAAKSGGGRDGFRFEPGDTFRVFFDSANDGDLVTTQVFRDPSAWYHFVIAVDTTQSTAANRVKIYVNGAQIENFSTETYPVQDYTGEVNNTDLHRIGADTTNLSNTLEGYLTEFHLVEGQQLAATDFGEEDSNGVWQPKEYTHGTAKHLGNWVADTSGTAFNNSHLADKAFDGSTSTSAAAASGGTLTFTPSTAITGITKVRIYAQRDSSASSATITLNGTDISSNWSNGDDKTVEITTDNLTSLAWTTQSNGQWFAVRRIEIYYSGAYYTLVPSNSFYLKFADNSSNAALGTDSSGNGNTWTVNNLTAGQFSPTATSTGDPASSTDSPFSSGYSVDFDGDDAIRFTGPGTITGDFTVECFVKSSSYGGTQRIFSADQAAQSGERLNLRCYNGNTEFYVASGVSASGTNFPTNQWNHIAITRSGSTVSYYLNGSRWATDTHSASFDVTTLVVAHGYGSEYFTGKVSNARFVDKQALYTGSSYTQPTATLTTTSQGAIADNVRLICCHQSSVTATQGTLSAANDIDSLLDTPTNYAADSGNNAGNYATLNPLSKGSNATLSNGNLDLSCGSSSPRIAHSTIGMTSGKYYCEYTFDSGSATNGLSGPSLTQTGYVGNAADQWGYYHSNGQLYNNNTGSSYGAQYSTGDIIGIAFDADNGTLTFYKNGTSQGTAATGLTSGPYFFAFGEVNYNGSVNFGQRPFAYTPPTGYVSLCTENLSESAYASIADGSTAFDVNTYSGNGSSQSIPLSFEPGLIWTKGTNNTEWHVLVDQLRATSRFLYANETNSESGNQSSGVTAFSSTGYTVGSSDYLNKNTFTYASWAWSAGTSSATSNTDGSITSSVRVSQANGFSIATYTGNGSTNSTVGHGLNAAPSVVIIKNRSNAYAWAVLHTSAGTTGTTLDGSAEYYMLQLDSGAARNNFTNDNIWNPTNSTFKINGEGTGNWVNASNDNYVAYSWAPVEGFSAFGSYEGNGSPDGPFVYTGHRARFLMIKCSTKSGEDWLMLDTARDTFNDADSSALYASLSHQNNSTSTITTDILSNGFKARATNAAINQSGQTYIYMSFASHPFRTARAR